MTSCLCLPVSVAVLVQSPLLGICIRPPECSNKGDGGVKASLRSNRATF